MPERSNASAAGSHRVAALIPPVWHATEIRKIAQAEDRVLAPGERVGFYDKGDPRYDETNQLEWYGRALPVILITREELDAALASGDERAFVIDKATYRERRFLELPHDVIAEEEHLVSIRLKPGPGAASGRAGQR